MKREDICNANVEMNRDRDSRTICFIYVALVVRGPIYLITLLWNLLVISTRVVKDD